MSKHRKDKEDPRITRMRESVKTLREIENGTYVHEGPEEFIFRSPEDNLLVDSVSDALKLARERTHFTTEQLLERGLSKGLEIGLPNPTVEALVDYVDTLGYNVTIILKPRRWDRGIEVRLPSYEPPSSQ